MIFLLCKFILFLKGKQVGYQYWDENFEYELVDKGYKYEMCQTKGGWTKVTKGIVFVYLIISPIFIVTQFITVVFAFIGLGKNKIFSYYGPISFDGLSNITLQKILHFLFGFVVVR